jgi:tripartite ATP-independent transporter DctP family solute receptor
MMKKTVVISMILLLGISGSGCKDVQSVRTLKLSHGMDQKHSLHLGLVYMSKYLDSISGGKMKVDIYPSAQLGPEIQNIEMVQIGSLAMTKVSSASLEGFADEYKVFGIPYMLRSKEHLIRTLDGDIGEDLKTSTEPFLFRGLGYYDAGARSFYTMKKPVLKPEDLVGQKIRVMKSPVAVAMMQAFGGSATPISWGELYTALQSGVVDGAENNLPSFVTSHHHDVAKHFTVNEHTMLPDVLIISTVVWSKLTKQEQEWLSRAVKESIAYQRILWEEQEVEALEEAKGKGVDFYYPDKKLFMDKVAGMRDMFKDNKSVRNMMERIDALATEMEEKTIQTNHDDTQNN